MAQKALVLGMLISLHSLGIIFASLFTFRWYIDNSRDIGIFGICEYFNSSSLDQFEINQIPSNRRFSNISYKINTIAMKNNQDFSNKINDSKLAEFLKILEIMPQASQLLSNIPKVAKTNGTTTVTTKILDSTPNFINPSTKIDTTRERTHMGVKRRSSLSDFEADTIIGLDVKPSTNDNSYSILQDYSMTYQKCFQLLWPNTDDAFDYLTMIFTRFFVPIHKAKPVYLTAMMGVAISSVSLGFLTFFWSFVCVIFSNVGGHARAGELLISLAILTDIANISTIGMFMAKDNYLHPFRFYGYSLWLSVGASCGFFLSSILFTINRINLGFKYMLRNYQNQFSE